MTPPAEGLASRLIVGPTLRTQPDGRLVALVRAGYENAFEEIVRRYGRPLSRYATAIVGGGSDEDVTQDAFSKAHLALCRNDAEIELRPWLFRIVRNTALNHLRDRPPTPEALAEAIAGGRSPAEELEQREELAELMRRLQTLPEPQRAAIVMRELEGLSHEEIAAALGLSGGGARQAIYRARCALRDGLGMLVPLPLLKTVLAAAAGVTSPAEVATGTAGAVGAGMALKATAVTILLAGTVGAGVAVQDAQHAKGGGIAQAAEKLQKGAPRPFAAGEPATSETQGRLAGGAGRDGAHRRTESHPRGAGSGVRGGSSGHGSEGSGGRNSASTRTDSSGHGGGSGGDPGPAGPHSESGSGSGSGGEGSGSGGSGTGDSSGSFGSSGSGSDSGPGGGESGGGTPDGGGGESGDGSSGGESSDSSSSGSGSGDSRDLVSSDGLTQQTAP